MRTGTNADRNPNAMLNEGTMKLMTETLRKNKFNVPGEIKQIPEITTKAMNMVIDHERNAEMIHAKVISKDFYQMGGYQSLISLSKGEENADI